MRFAAAVLLLATLAGCDRATKTSPGSADTSKGPATAPATNRNEPPSLVFRDAVEGSGVDFVHDSGYNERKDFPTSLGSAAAIFDYDGDGRQDLYFTSVRAFPLADPSKAMGNRLYRNLGGLRFEDVTEKAKVGYKGFSHGVAVGDVNNDKKPDLYLTNYGGNVLYLNNGDGTFRDASAGSGCDVGIWCSGAAFLDYDFDGNLDLYVSRYGKWVEEGPHEYCGDAARGMRMICSPYKIQPETHILLKGHGDGTFHETTEAAGVFRRDGRGLAVISADINRDGKPDIYVANDGCPNFLFINKGNGTFENAGERAGAALDANGEVQGSMGADIQDVDGDGLPEVLVTNYRGQYTTLYQNMDGHSFEDVSVAAGLIKDSRPYVGWGCTLSDFDNDGLPDMFVVNGEVDNNLRQFGQEIDFAQPMIVRRNVGKGRFKRVENPGAFAEKNWPARGLAVGDLDEDGDLDVVVLVLDAKPVILINESPNQGNWIRFSLEATRGHHEAIGATVEVHAGGKVHQRLVKGGDSYISVNDRRVHVGIGDARSVDKVEILWPGGTKSEIKGPETRKTHRVVEP